MPSFSISLQKPARVGEPKTTFDVGELLPTVDRAVEIRVDTTAYRHTADDPQTFSPVAFWADMARLLQRVRELDEPRPVRTPPTFGAPWSDGTFWSDNTGWIE